MGEDNTLQISKRNNRNKRRAIKITSLNIKGRGSDSIQFKWMEINQLMRESKINIMAIQETHINKEREEVLNKLFDRQARIITSSDPDRPNAMGVASL